MEILMWQDNLKDSLGIPITLKATMTHNDGCIEEYVWKNKILMRRESDTSGRKFGDWERQKIITSGSEEKPLVMWTRYVFVSDKEFLDFLKHWKDTGFYKVTLNGKPL